MVVLMIGRLLLYLVAFASSAALSAFLLPVRMRLATSLALVMISIAVHSAIMEVILLNILLLGRRPEMWMELLLTIDAALIAVASTGALYSFRRLGRNNRSGHNT